MLHIVNNGYLYEVNHAFMPLLPLILKTLGSLGLDVLHMAFFLEQLCAFAATLVLYYLSKRVLRDQNKALYCSILFTLNHSVIYSIMIY